MEKKISRRYFVKKAGLGSAILGAAALSSGLASCKKKRNDVAEAGPLGPIPTDKMTYRINPKTGEKVSLLGYGCMRIPSVDNTSTRESDSSIDQEMWNKLVDYAIEHGVTYFDTSPAYCKGQSEKATGIALSRHKREEYTIATKLSNFAPSTWTKEESIKMYRNSFKMLQVDYIDYYLLHSVGNGDFETFENRYIKNGMLDFLLKEREAGRIRNLGFSYHGDVKVFDYLLANHDKYHWDFVQIQMNYLDWKHANELNKRNQNAKPQNSVASWAFRWVGSFPGVLTVLSGMTYMEHLQDNLRSFCPLDPVTEEDNQFLEETALLLLKYPTIPCNDCQYCMPCPYGIDIPGNLLLYNKCINEGNMASSKPDPNYRKARKAFLVGYARKLAPERMSDHCIGCRHCVPHCPQNIDIPAQLQKIDQYYEKLMKEEEL